MANGDDTRNALHFSNYISDNFVTVSGYQKLPNKEIDKAGEMFNKAYNRDRTGDECMANYVEDLPHFDQMGSTVWFHREDIIEVPTAVNIPPNEGRQQITRPHPDSLLGRAEVEDVPLA
ncbi:unnamed protein product [Heligmosomoides polygyrus]|uniref:SnoaL-like domain-containing protein n=1 Tax=Heligmosomoides polygyrus TaxID=6339 RepID=A0A183GQQ7_HELPZ|nr:unnamed protein product [Heligmosomoides polygyrus]